MEHLGYHYRPEARVRLTKADLKLLMKLSDRHYDSRCQSAGREGGFLYGMWNWCTFSKKPVEQSLTFDKIDTLCKVCEPVVMVTKDQSKLFYALRALLVGLNTEYCRLNNVPTA